MWNYTPSNVGSTSIPNREKYNKLCKVCQTTLLLVSGAGATLPQSDTSLLSYAVAKATAIRHIGMTLTSSTAILSLHVCLQNST